MSKKMLINATLHEENRVAIVNNGILSELDIEVAGREQTKGNIYKAVVVRVEPGLQAAFVDYGAERLGFLQIDEINFKLVKPDYTPPENGRSRPKITELLTRGQEILVQIIKEERGTKGAALTTYLSLAGRYMVLMPDSKTRGVSRKAENDGQRKQLKKIMATLEMPEQFGYIVRTAALDQTHEELERDYRYLMRLHESIGELQQKAKAPALIYKESNLVIRSIRDYFTTDMDEVLIDNPEVFKEAREFFKMVMPDQANLVKLHQERRPIFSRYQIEDQIETISSNKVGLPSGGSIVIDTTEALVAIDVNSGKMASEQGVEGTATKANTEAAEEIGRQLRLRDLGGLIVIDFIDMRDRKHIRQVEKKLKESTALDKARINIGRISQFGLLEMSRQRIKAALSEGAYLSCPHCSGFGRIKSPETLAAALLRRIHTGVAKGQVSRVNADLPLEVASYLLNNKREELLEMERRYNVQILIHGQPDLHADQAEIDFQKREKTSAPQDNFVSAATLPALTEEKAADGEQKPEQGAEEEASQEGQRSNGRRRRRRRSRKTSSESAATAEQTTEATEASKPEAGDEPTQDQAKEPSAEVEKKPRRRRGSRGKAKATEAAQAEQKAASLEQPEEALKDTSEKPEAAPKPARKPRTRKPAQAKAATDEAKAPETATEAPAEAVEASADVPSEPKKKPATRRGRPQKVADKSDTGEAAGDKQEQSATTVETEPAKKPTRRGRPKKTTASKETTSEAAKESKQEKPSEKAESSTDPVKAPAKRRGRPRKTVAKPAEEAPGDNQAPATGEKAAPPEKPKRKRTTRAQPSPKEDAAPKASTEAAETTPKEPPKPRRRAPRKKATVSES